MTLLRRWCLCLVCAVVRSVPAAALLAFIGPKATPCRPPSPVWSSMPSSSHQLIPTALVIIGAVWGFLPDLSSAQVWEFATTNNGQVELPDSVVTFGRQRLRHPRFLGSGGGGAVFALDSSSDDNDDDEPPRQVALKISWVKSAESLRNECRVLQALQERHVTTGVERCLGSGSYPPDTRRSVILLEPVFDNDAARLEEVPEALRSVAVRCVIRTLVQLLAAGVVTTDVQPLVSTLTGDVLFIDFTEAKILSDRPSLTDLALTNSFIAEMLSLIPTDQSLEASHSLMEELKDLEHTGKRSIPSTMMEFLHSQGELIFSQEALDFLDFSTAAQGDESMLPAQR